MATSDVLFPTDFERLYNLPFQWADSNLGHAHLRGQEHPALQETDPDRIQRLSEEIGKAMHRSLRHKQERAMARGGDLITKEGQELGRRLVKKRGEEFASRQTGTPAVPSVPSAEVPFTESETLANDLETSLQQMTNLIITGAVSGDLLSASTKVIGQLSQRGNILTAGQLDTLYQITSELIRSLPPFRASLPADAKRILPAFSLNLDVIRRTLQFLQKYANRQPRERKIVMSTLRKSIASFVRTKQPREQLGRPLREPGQAGLPADALRIPFRAPGDLETGLVPAGPIPRIRLNPPARPPTRRIRVRLPAQNPNLPGGPAQQQGNQ